ncbi:hypothetical protein P2Q00_49835 [Streptomyces coacervatus]|nr:hypothetical protein [Streptomyces coacervatus]MDF2273434.1 hypothetical protein [Streptomyces coacervatus]
MKLSVRLCRTFALAGLYEVVQVWQARVAFAPVGGDTEQALEG